MPLFKVIGSSLLSEKQFDEVDAMKKEKTKLGSFDVDDIILNSTGAMIAYGIVRLLLRNPFISKLLEKTEKDFKQLNEEARIN